MLLGIKMQGSAADTSGMTFRRIPHGDDGFAIAEALVAVMLAAIASVGVAAGLGATAKHGTRAQTTNAATAIARAEYEKTRVTGYGSLAHATGSLAGDPAVSGPNFDPDGTGPLAPEPIVYASDGLASPVTTTAQQGITYTTRRYVTTVGANLKRLTVTIAWTEAGQPRTTSLSSLVASTVQPIVASANALVGSSAGPVGTTASAKVNRGGGYDSQSVGSVTPVPGWTANSASATARAKPAVHHRAEATISSATTSLTGLTISMTGVTVVAEAFANGAVSTTSTGAVTINGVTYNNPAPGTTLTVGPWTVSLAGTTNEPDGSKGVSFVRIQGAGGTEYRWAWAWVAPVTTW